MANGSADDLAAAAWLSERRGGGNDVIRQLQCAVPRGEWLEAVVGRAVFEPESGIGNRQLAPRIAPGAVRAEDIKRNTGQPHVGPGEPSGDITADFRGKIGDAEARGIGARPQRDIKRTHLQRARPGKAERSAGKPDRGRAEATGEIERGRTRRKPGSARIRGEDRPAARRTQGERAAQQRQIGVGEPIEADRRAFAPDRESVLRRPVAVERQRQIARRPAGQRSAETRTPGESQRPAARLDQHQFRHRQPRLTRGIFGHRCAQGEAAGGPALHPPGDLRQAHAARGEVAGQARRRQAVGAQLQAREGEQRSAAPSAQGSLRHDQIGDRAGLAKDVAGGEAAARRFAAQSRPQLGEQRRGQRTAGGALGPRQSAVQPVPQPHIAAIEIAFDIDPGEAVLRARYALYGERGQCRLRRSDPPASKVIAGGQRLLAEAESRTAAGRGQLVAAQP